MYGTTGLISSLLGAYHMSEVSMRYSRFMPRAYNLAISLGFNRGKIMPFCTKQYISISGKWRKKVVVDNLLLHAERDEGLLLKLDSIVQVDDRGIPKPELSRSTAKVFRASPALLDYLGDYEWKSGRGEAIGCIQIFSFINARSVNIRKDVIIWRKILLM